MAINVAQVRRIALALPEAAEAPHFHYASFRVRGNIFATVPPEGRQLHVCVGDDDRTAALALDFEFLEKLLWGGRVVGLRVALAQANPGVVKRLLSLAWARKAPKSLVASAPTRRRDGD
jgi:hypothetical protein